MPDEEIRSELLKKLEHAICRVSMKLNEPIQSHENFIDEANKLTNKLASIDRFAEILRNFKIMDITDSRIYLRTNLKLSTNGQNVFWIISPIQGSCRFRTSYPVHVTIRTESGCIGTPIPVVSKMIRLISQQQPTIGN